MFGDLEGKRTNIYIQYFLWNTLILLISLRICVSNVGYTGNSLRWQIDKTGLLPYEWVASYSTSKCCL